MPTIVLGPWQWSVADNCWQGPTGCLQGLDFRPLSVQGQAGVAWQKLGWGLFVVPDGVAVDGDYRTLGSGTLQSIKTNQKMLDGLPCRPGYKLTATNLQEYVWEVLTAGATPDGSDFARPLMPNVNRQLQLRFAGLKYAESFAWGDKYTSNVRDVIREGFADTFARQSKDSKLAEMTLDYQMQKLRVSDWKEFVPTKLQSSVSGPVPHKTSYSDNFNRANGDLDSGGAWSIVGGANIDIISNQVGPGAIGANNRQGTCRYNSALSGADHWSQVTLAGLTNTLGNLGPTTRFSPSANTTYLGLMRKNDQLLGKMVNNVYTQLAQQTASGTTIGTVGRLESDGSDHTLTLNGVTSIAQTDTSIPSQLYCGLYVRCSDADERADDWSCSDIVTGIDGTLPNSANASFTAQAPTGLKSAVVGTASFTEVGTTPSSKKECLPTASGMWSWAGGTVGGVSQASSPSAAFTGEGTTPTGRKAASLSSSSFTQQGGVLTAIKLANLGSSLFHWVGQDILDGPIEELPTASYTWSGITPGTPLKLSTAPSGEILGSGATTETAKEAEMFLSQPILSGVVVALYPGYGVPHHTALIKDRSGNGLDGVIEQGDDYQIAATDCVLRLAADAGLTMSALNVVEWADQSGKGNDVSRSPASDAPTLVAVSGKQWLHFDNQGLFRSGYIGSGGDITVIGLYRISLDNAVAFPRILTITDGNSSVGGTDRLMFFTYWTVNAIPYIGRRNTSGGVGTPANSLPLGVIGCVTGRFAGTTGSTFIDAVQKGGSPAGSLSLVAGGRTDIAGVGSLTKCDIAELRVYDRALADAEITALTRAIRRKWLDEYYNTPSPWVLDAGQYAISFDGIDDKISIPNNTALDSSAGTWACWLKTDGNWLGGGGSGGTGRGYAALLSRIDNVGASGGKGIVLAVSPLGGLRVVFFGSVDQNISGTTSDNVWHHVALKWDSKSSGGNWWAYIDGQQVGTGTFASDWSFNGQGVWIGDAPHEFWEEYKGLVDDVVILSRAATADEVAFLATKRGALYESAETLAQFQVVATVPQANKQSTPSSGLVNVTCVPSTSTKEATSPSSVAHWNGVAGAAEKEAAVATALFEWNALDILGVKEAIVGTASFTGQSTIPNAEKEATITSALFQWFAIPPYVPIPWRGWTLGARQQGWTLGARQQGWRLSRKNWKLKRRP